MSIDLTAPRVPALHVLDHGSHVHMRGGVEGKLYGSFSLRLSSY
jgi:hypothetical protein